MIRSKSCKVGGHTRQLFGESAKGERVLIQDTNPEPEFVNALVRAVHKAGGLAFVSLRDKSVERTLYLDAPEEQFELQARLEQDRMKEMDAYIGFTSLRNSLHGKTFPPTRWSCITGIS